jgi:hypothetical protein
LDETKKWVRPIKPDDGFLEKEITMDNGEVVDIFDVVTMEFGDPIPIKHHVENMTFLPNKKIQFVKKLSDNEKSALLKEISDPRLLSAIETKYALYDAILKSGRSIAPLGPIVDFNIGYDSHPKIYFTGKNDKKFSVPCTDIKFCAFIKTKSEDFRKNGFRMNSKEIPELKGKQTYFVIGLTGDHLDENANIVSGTYAPPDGSMEPRYWPMVVSVLIVPDYT